MLLAYGFQLFLDFSGYLRFVIGIASSSHPPAGTLRIGRSYDVLVALAHVVVLLTSRLSLHAAAYDAARSVAAAGCARTLNGYLRSRA
jgi:hypothetical protein